MKPIYFDHNASTPLEKDVIEKMKSVLDNNFGNPSSSHIYGIQSKQIIEEARDFLGRMLTVEPEEIIFTSGGSESNNFAIRGIADQYPGCHIITSQIEHPSVQKVCDELESRGFEISRISVHSNGLIDLDELKNSISSNTKLITIMLANNETGVIQPIKGICETVKNKNIIVHTDAAQAAGKIKIDAKEMGVDLMTIAAHKMYGPKGVGALYIKNGVKIKPIILGASHENGLRAGTENVLEIAGLGKAAQIFADNYTQIVKEQKRLRDHFFQMLSSDLDEIDLNGTVEKMLPNTANIYFRNCDANRILAEIPEIAASSGAACHADSIEPSQVLKAMGFSDNRALGSIRFSFGRFNTDNEIEIATQKIISVVKELRGEYLNEKVKEEKSLSLQDSALGCSCKLSPKNLNSILGKISREKIFDNILGFENSDDASVYFIDENMAILSSVDFFSPVVENPFDFGRIAAANALSDIYAMGGTPLFANNIVAFPESKLSSNILVEILKGAQTISDEAGIEILGGHSIKDDSVKFGMSVTGSVQKQNLLTNAGAKVGDVLILTKALGSGILCQAMKKGLLKPETIDIIVTHMVQLNKYAAEEFDNFNITACTDISGFGLIGHLSEMLLASGKSAEIYSDKIPIFDHVRKMVRQGIMADGFLGNFEYFDSNVDWSDSISQPIKKILFDPQTSGGLLFTINKDNANKIVQNIQNKDADNVAIIGQIIDKKEKLIYIE